MTPPMQPDTGGRGHGRRVCDSRLKQARDDGRTTCTNPRGFKTDHPGYGTCYLHGGATPSGNAAAVKERAEQLLLDAQHTFGLATDVEPAEALLELLATTAGASAWLTRQVQQLAAGQVVHDGKPHPLVALWQEERKEARAVAKAAHDAGLGERMVRLEEDKARFVITLIEALLRRLDEYVLEQTGRRVLDPQDGPVRALVAAAVAEVQEVTAA